MIHIIIQLLVISFAITNNNWAKDTPFQEFSIFLLIYLTIKSTTEEMKKHGYRIWYNSLWDTFNGGHDDEMALDDPDGSYGWLLDKGANIIFCDNSFLLLDYLKKKGRR